VADGTPPAAPIDDVASTCRARGRAPRSPTRSSRAPTGSASR
jgi:hypothetical protein